MSQHQRPGPPDLPRLALAGGDPIDEFVRIVGRLRWLLLALSIGVNLVRLPRATSPALVIAACVLMFAATAGLSWAQRVRPQWHAWRSWAELALGCGLVLLTPLALPGDLRIPSLAGFWVSVSALMVILVQGPWRGVLAALLVGASTLWVPGGLAVDDIAFVVALVCGGAALGWTIQYVRHTALEREHAMATAAAMAERQRLARIVHDGVLQVLAMVEREARHLGPRGALLARSAHEQEVQLRALIQETDIDPTRPDKRDVTHRNVAVLLDRHASQQVSVATPVEPLLMESRRAAELDAAVTEALNNVAKHAGPGAKAWVFLEVEAGEATVSIRDNGVGGDPNQFAAAMQNGRMGMKDSIYGRIHDLGGTATLRTAPGRGVEWEFRVPIEL